MAKVKETKSTFEEIVADLNKKYRSEGIIERTFISTGSILLDNALGGGVSTGRITELIAWEGAGKSTVCQHILANAQKLGMKVAYIDAEHSLDPTYAEAIGVDWKALLPTLFQPTNGEDAFHYGMELIKTGELGVIIFDSTSGMIPKKQLEGDPGTSVLGLHSRLFSQEIPKISAMAATHNTAVVFVSQIREKIGVMFGSPETTQAGNALKFFASNRIELRKTLEKEGDVTIGINSKFKVIKCKTNSPYSTGVINIIFGKGINSDPEVMEIAIENNIISLSGNTYSYEGVKIGVGQKQLEAFFTDNPEVFEEIKLKVINKLQNKTVQSTEEIPLLNTTENE